jgi:tRNA modification GTPase
LLPAASALACRDATSCVSGATTPDLPSQTRIDELAQQAAIEALQSCHTVLFCVDLTKDDWSEDLAARSLIRPKDVVYVATKSDLLPTDELPQRLDAMAKTFNSACLPVSAKLSRGLDSLLDAVESSLLGRAVPVSSSEHAQGAVLLARHKQAIEEAMDSIHEAAGQVRQGNDEVAVTMLRSAIEALSQIERQHIDEQVLDRIFSRFCIGK